MDEAQRFLETFVPYHLGKEPRSLKVLRQIRPVMSVPAPAVAEGR
jgi:hypothetical protein